VIDFDAMEVGQTLPLTTETKWEAAPRREYIRAQECTERTGYLFEVQSIHKDMPAGRVLAGFTITRTR